MTKKIIITTLKVAGRIALALIISSAAEIMLRHYDISEFNVGFFTAVVLMAVMGVTNN